MQIHNSANFNAELALWVYKMQECLGPVTTFKRSWNIIPSFQGIHALIYVHHCLWKIRFILKFSYNLCNKWVNGQPTVVCITWESWFYNKTFKDLQTLGDFSIMHNETGFCNYIINHGSVPVGVRWLPHNVSIQICLEPHHPVSAICSTTPFNVIHSFSMRPAYYVRTLHYSKHKVLDLSVLSCSAYYVRTIQVFVG